jgi:hypothetical protein
MATLRKRRSPVDRIMAAMDRLAFARGEANWCNGYRAGRPDCEESLWPKQQKLWAAVDREERRFKRLVQRVLREARKGATHG